MHSYLLKPGVQDLLPCVCPMSVQTIFFTAIQVSAFNQIAVKEFMYNVLSLKLVAWKDKDDLIFQIISYQLFS